MTCIDCGADFVFSGAEQQFFQEKGFHNPPKRCRSCRATRRQDAPGPKPVETTVTCAYCGTLTTVPFRPRLSRPVYCRTCFNNQPQPPVPLPAPDPIESGA